MNKTNKFNQSILRSGIADKEENCMSDFIGVKCLCSLCKGSLAKENDITCGDKNGSLHALKVNNVLCAPCMTPKETAEEALIKEPNHKVEP